MKYKFKEMGKNAIIIIFMLVLTACSNSEPTNTSVPSNPLLVGKLKRINNVNPDGNNVYGTLTYDDNGRVIKYVEENETSTFIISTREFTRNQSGVITKMIFTDINANQQVITDFVVDVNGKYLSSIKTKPGTTAEPLSSTYVYQNNLISQINYSDGIKTRYTYGANRNVIKIEESYNDNTWQTSATYGYDNKINPYELEFPIWNRCGSNNIVSTTGGQSIIQTQYVYNVENKPVKATNILTNSANNSTQTRIIEYTYY